MCVRPAEPERAHPRDPPPSGPASKTRWAPDRQLVPGDVRARRPRNGGAAGSRRCCSDSTTLISPAIPAAASRWPMFVFTEPRRRRPLRRTPLAQHGQRGHAPRWDPPGESPCRAPPRSSTSQTAATPALARASRSTASWARPFGAVRPPLRPSWLTAAAPDHREHRVAVALGRPTAASGRRRRSPRRDHSRPPRASNVLHRPSAAIIRAREKLIVTSGQRA